MNIDGFSWVGAGFGWNSNTSPSATSATGPNITINNTFILNQINALPRDAMDPSTGARCGCGVPNAAWVPPPQMPLSGAPAGKGLTDVSGQTSADGTNGWPQNTTQDAAGAHFVIKGGTEVDVFAPGQNPCDSPYQRIQGDPHSNFEQAGRATDYTGSKDANGQSGQDFQYPWGTRMYTQTTSDTGRSQVNGVTLWSGADRQTWTGVDGTPQTDGIHHDGFETRAEHIATQGDRPTWDLGGSLKNVDIMQESHGQLDGTVTGTHFDGQKYVADLDQTTPMGQQLAQFRSDTMGGGLRPNLFTNPGGYGEMLRGFADDRFANRMSQGGWFGSPLAQMYGAGLHVGDQQAKLRQLMSSFWGGLGSVFPSWGSVSNALSGLYGLMMNGGQLYNDYNTSRLMSSF